MPAATNDWHEWHEGYDDSASEMSGRMRAVRAHVAAAVSEAPAGPVTLVSICGGEGRESIGALAGHPRRGDVRGRLIELDPHNAAAAQRLAAEIGLEGFEVVNGDASHADAYAGLPPVDVVVISGLFGHISDKDHGRVLAFLRQIARPGAIVVWTYTALLAERVSALRQRFVDGGFEELAFERIPGDELALTVMLSRHAGLREPFEPHRSFFTFGSSRRTDAVVTKRA